MEFPDWLSKETVNAIIDAISDHEDEMKTEQRKNRRNTWQRPSMLKK